MPSLEDFAELIPESLRPKSGRVFYSGRAAFERPSDLYVLGLNPGGDPIAQVASTVWADTLRTLGNSDRRWSAYRDESWEGKPPGSHQMQPRIRHLFGQIQRDAGDVPCSNLVFVRTKQESELQPRFRQLADLCWQFHQVVIEIHRPKVVVCLGARAGDYVRRKMRAYREVDRFVESNNRHWVSRTYKSEAELRVVVLVHPSRVAWRNPDTDPTGLVQRALLRG